MAILKAWPGSEAIAQLRGSVDIYMWKGLVVARSWPRRSRQPNSPAQLRARDNMRQAVKWVQTNPKFWHDEWADECTPPTMGTVQVQRSQAMKMLVLGILTRPPDVTSITVTPKPLDGVTVLEIQCVNYPGFDLNLVKWRGHSHQGHHLPLTYMQVSGGKCKDGVRKPAWLPLLSEFKEPEILTRIPAGPTFELTFKEVAANWSVYATPEAAGNQDLLLSSPLNAPQ